MLVGTAGDDEINGGGNDELSREEGNDTLNGGEGNDTSKRTDRDTGRAPAPDTTGG